MGDVTISRGKGFTDDTFETGWTLFQGGGGSPSFTTDGDIVTAVGGTQTAAWDKPVPGSLSTNTYQKAMGRARRTVGTGSCELDVIYTDGSQTIQFFTSSSFQPPTVFNLTAGKTIDRVRIWPTSNTTMEVDFIFIFKEVLTLPAITQPMPLSVRANVVELPILDRQGGVLQHLGSMSPEIIIQGALVTTTTPTNHTAAEWWNILEGLVLEGANETWQWLSSDRVNYKYLPTDLSRNEILARKNYYEFTLRLKRFDVLSATTDRLGYSY